MFVYMGHSTELIKSQSWKELEHFLFLFFVFVFIHIFFMYTNCITSMAHISRFFPLPKFVTANK